MKEGKSWLDNWEIWGFRVFLIGRAFSPKILSAEMKVKHSLLSITVESHPVPIMSTQFSHT
jgi:hypothetical protein